MIKVKVEKDLITIDGHANHDDYGKDIVCASASSIVITTVNSIIRLEPSSITYSENGILEIRILKHLKNTDELINNMIDLLKELEKDYPKHIKIRRC